MGGAVIPQLQKFTSITDHHRLFFQVAEQKRLIDKFWHCLNPGGYLFVGHAESLFGLTQKFRMVHENNGTAYKRIEVGS